MIAIVKAVLEAVTKIKVWGWEGEREWGQRERGGSEREGEWRGERGGEEGKRGGGREIEEGRQRERERVLIEKSVYVFDH